MTITDIISLRDNKHYCYCDHNELKEVKDQITCLQKSVANLRKDIPELVAKKIIEMKQKDLGRKGSINDP
jgi:hypothetical protein